MRNIDQAQQFWVICQAKLGLVLKKGNQSLLACTQCTLTSFYQRKTWFQLQLTGQQGQ